MNINRSLTLGTQDEREAASKQLKGPTPSFSGDKEAFINDVMSALFCSKIVSYAQGFILMRMPSAELPLSHNIHAPTPARARTLTRKHARDHACFLQRFGKLGTCAMRAHCRDVLGSSGAAADEFKWTLNYGGIALMWRGGCIIRSTFLKNIKDAFATNPNLR